MTKEELIVRAGKLCPSKDKKEGKCGCKIEVSVGQTNFIPIETTRLICWKRVH